MEADPRQVVRGVVADGDEARRLGVTCPWRSVECLAAAGSLSPAPVAFRQAGFLVLVAVAVRWVEDFLVGCRRSAALGHRQDLQAVRRWLGHRLVSRREGRPASGLTL